MAGRPEPVDIDAQGAERADGPLEAFERALRRLGDKPRQIERAARFRPRAREPRAAERLHADGRADDVAVDINVARLDPFDHASDRLVDAGVQAEGEPIAGGVDRIDQRIEPIALVAQHMQNRAEHFALDVGDFVDLDHRRREEGSARVRRAEFGLRHREAAAPHRLDMPLDRIARLGRDDRADVRREPARIADFELGHRALQHLEHAVGDILLQTEDAQRRASLAGRIEG